VLLVLLVSRIQSTKGRSTNNRPDTMAATALVALASVTRASILALASIAALLLLVLIFLLFLVLLVMVLQFVCANRTNDAAYDGSEDPAAGFVSYESSTCSTDQSCSKTLLSILSWAIKPSSWGSSYALAVVAVLLVLRLRGVGCGVRRALLAAILRLLRWILRLPWVLLVLRRSASILRRWIAALLRRGSCVIWRTSIASLRSIIRGIRILVLLMALAAVIVLVGHAECLRWKLWSARLEEG